MQALSGSALYRKASFLVDSLGRQVLPKGLSLFEDPFQISGNGSSPFDDEGVQVRPRKVIDAGVVQGYFLSSYTARKLRMSPTGNAGGSHNLLLKTESPSLLVKGGLEALVRKMHKGLLVTEVMGQGVNPLTGDYSRGALVIGLNTVKFSTRWKKSLLQVICLRCSWALKPCRTTFTVGAPKPPGPY